jgi:phosphoribosylformimino-5-aminoimidazole carboxamide ribotide isomerase
MRIIPVLDMMGGQVVQGIQGDRAHYQPVKSVLTPSCSPLAVARALSAETGCDALYVADLDAIEGRGAQREPIRELAVEIPAHLWVDAGVQAVEAVPLWIDAGVGRVVVGSETLDSVASLDAIRAAFPAERLVFSLDLQGGQILSRCPELRALSPLSLLGRLQAGGWTHVILLTLDRVGAGGGPDWPLLEAARDGLPELMLIAGGGVRGIEDVHRLTHLGVYGVLVASALHNGRLTGKELHALTTGPAAQERSPGPCLPSGTQRGWRQ